MAEKSKIFIIGATGKYGRYVVEASVNLNHSTVALARQSTIDTDPEKAKLVEKFKNWGVEIVYGDIDINHEILVTTMKQVDVVISCIGGPHVADQVNIISAIKEAGNIKKFFPSEYAIDVDHIHDPVEPAASFFAAKAKIRRTIESEGIPHTYVVGNGFAERFWPNLAQVEPVKLLPDIDKVDAYGDGNSKITATMEKDVATFTIKAVDDPRTLNKILYVRPPSNILSFNELFTLWEKKSGKTLQRTYYSEEQLLQMIKESNAPVLLSVCYSVAIKNDYASYKIESSFGVEASEIYPEVKYTTINEYLDEFVTDAPLSVVSLLLKRIKGSFLFYICWPQ